MRMHITIDDGLVAELDRRVGRGRRSSFIAALLRQAMEDEGRWDKIEAALGSMPADSHPWDDDPATWVREQRRSDSRRAG